MKVILFRSVGEDTPLFCLFVISLNEIFTLLGSVEGDRDFRVEKLGMRIRSIPKFRSIDWTIFVELIDPLKYFFIKNKVLFYLG